MNSGCEEGLRLRRRFETELKEWGWFDAYEKAVEIMPVGLPKVHEFQRQVSRTPNRRSLRHAMRTLSTWRIVLCVAESWLYPMPYQ